MYVFLTFVEARLLIASIKAKHIHLETIQKDMHMHAHAHAQTHAHAHRHASQV